MPSEAAILHKAEAKLAKHRNMQNHYNTCLKAGICPKCGLDLTGIPDYLEERFYQLYDGGSALPYYCSACKLWWEALLNCDIPIRVEPTQIG